MLAWLEADLQPSTRWGGGGVGGCASYYLASVHSGRSQAAATILHAPLQCLGDLQIPDTDELAVSKQRRKCLWCLWFQISKIQI